MKTKRHTLHCITRIWILFCLVFFSQCETKTKKNPNLGLFALLLNTSSNNVKPPIYSAFADSVVSAPGQTGEGFKNASNAINGVRGGGCCAGGLDVYSLGTEGESASLVLEWKGKKVVNGAGIDFVVFENSFQNGTDSAQLFMEQAIVEVSRDGVNYCGFSPAYQVVDQTVYSNQPKNWVKFAGTNSVLFHEENNRLSEEELFDRTKAGGDGFDLEELTVENDYGIGCSAGLRSAILSEGFLYLKITGAGARINPATGAKYVQDSGSFDKAPDLDGVAARYLKSR